MILHTLRTTFDACKPLPKVSSALRFFSASKVGYESPKNILSAEDKKRREQSRQWDDIPGFKSNVDPEYRRDLRKIVAAANRRYYRNPDHREKLMAKSKTTNALYRAEPDFYIKQRLRVWLHTSAWARDELDWKAHKPVWSAVKVSRYCASCQIERYNGAHLWWVRMHLYRPPGCGICHDLAVPYYSSRKKHADFVSWWLATQV